MKNKTKALCVYITKERFDKLLATRLNLSQQKGEVLSLRGIIDALIDHGYENPYVLAMYLTPEALKGKHKNRGPYKKKTQLMVKTSLDIPLT